MKGFPPRGLYRRITEGVHLASRKTLWPVGVFHWTMNDQRDRSNMEQTPMPVNEKVQSVSEEAAKTEVSSTYGPYCPTKLDFDPLKDLNLPDSYNEVLKRFKGLQGERTTESLN